MKKSRTIDVNICDFCKDEKTSTYTKCLKCGKDVCYDCQRTQGKEYIHGVNHSGTGDGFYCTECIAALTLSGDDRLFNAYRLIARIRLECTAFYEDVKRRGDAAEKDLQNILNGKA